MITRLLTLFGLFLHQSDCFTVTRRLVRPVLSLSASRVDPKALGRLDGCNSSTLARRVLQEAFLNEDENSRLFDSVKVPPGASSKGLSDADLAIQTRTANRRYSVMELVELSGDRDADRASFFLLCLTVSSSVSALTVDQTLLGAPEILRFLLVWLLTFAPLFYVGYGIADADQLQTLLVSVQRQFFPAYRRRMLQHEAGHFLVAYLLGYPVQGYRANAVKNAVQLYPLADGDRGQSYASQLGFDRPTAVENDLEDPSPVMVQDAPFFSEEGRGALWVEERSVFRAAKKNYTMFAKLPQVDQPTNAWPYRGFDERTLDQLACISVAGVCSEILAFGNAEGGVADLSQLRQIFAASEEEIDSRGVDNRIRYALGFTMGMLRRNLGALDDLAAAMEKDAPLSACVATIENCSNPSGQDGITGDYERRRRERFRADGASWMERVLLGGDKNLDQEENRLVEGKGGGYRKDEFRLTGDDPFYAALLVSVTFAAWAAAGGLSLH